MKRPQEIPPRLFSTGQTKKAVGLSVPPRPQLTITKETWAHYDHEQQYRNRHNRSEFCTCRSSSNCLLSQDAAILVHLALLVKWHRALILSPRLSARHLWVRPTVGLWGPAGT